MIVRTASVDELPQIEAMYAAIVDAMQNTTTSHHPRKQHKSLT